MYGVVPIENSASGAEFQETPEVDRVKLERTGCYISYIDLYRYIYIEVIYIYISVVYKLYTSKPARKT